MPPNLLFFMFDMEPLHVLTVNGKSMIQITFYSPEDPTKSYIFATYEGVSASAHRQQTKTDVIAP